MKRVGKSVRIGGAILALVAVSVFGLIGYYEVTLPDAFYQTDSQKIIIASRPMLTVDQKQETDSTVDVSMQLTAGQTATVRLWGIIPVKTVQLKKIDRQERLLGGELFGIRLYTEGVLVVELDRVTTASGRCSPAVEAGIEVGDCILSVDGKSVESNEQLRNLVASSGGKTLTLRVRRQQRVFTVTLQPAYTTSGVWRCGIWVRDSTAGIGTLTCVDPDSGDYVGLGHGIYDADTGVLMQLSEGSICGAKLTGIIKGVNGIPGKLEGILTEDGLRGSLTQNTAYGIGGSLESEYQSVCYPVAMRQEVKTGSAYLYCSLGEEPDFYEIRIEKVDLSDGKKSKNLVIRVTDERLLEKTGGIVQGMSGSPIIQDGKLVGAVTHVFVNRADKGYGIFIENMPEAAG